MKVIIAGSRDFSDYTLLVACCDKILSKQKDAEIVSGAARGADQLGELYARDHGHPIKRFPADWVKYGKSAGHRRNEEMAKYADAAIIFWDGKSVGTKSMIDLAKKYKLSLRVIEYTKKQTKLPL